MTSSRRRDDSPGPVSWQDLEDAARRRLPPDVFDFIAGGAEDEHALDGSRSAWSSLRLRPRVLAGVDHVDTSVELLGEIFDSPLLVAPMGAHVLVHPDGEIATARAAARTGVGYISSTASSSSLEIEAEAHPRPWFQLYAYRDRAVTRDLMERAATAGHRAIVLTVDTPVLGVRRRDLRNRFAPTTRWANLDRYAASALPDADDGTAIMQYIAAQLDPSLTWDDVAALVHAAPLPVVVKGVLRGDDARIAVEVGAAGVYVSNHGGRQLDRAVAPIEALAEVGAACAGRVPVLLDGGVRTASDVVLALALGADAVAIGRPVLWALAHGGEDGVLGYLADLLESTRRALAMMGVRRPRDLSAETVLRLSSPA